MEEPWIKRGIQWLLSKQQSDGSWGETEKTYREPRLAGTGPGVPPLTGLALWVLIAAGRAKSEEVVKGIDYLLKHQRSDGRWDNGPHLTTVIPPDTFYLYPEAAMYYPSEALGRFIQTVWPDGTISFEP